MATLREYFDSDLKYLSSRSEWNANDISGNQIATILVRIWFDFDANARFWSLYIPEVSDIRSIVSSLFDSPEIARCVINPKGDAAKVQMGLAGYSEYASTDTMVFTKRIHLYIDDLLDPSLRQQIAAHGSLKGFHVLVRDRGYAMSRSQAEKPIAFISHDARDKDSLVRELAQELSLQMCPVWSDEYSLQVGDSLRASIENGIKEAQKCVIILSPNFFSNEGWGKAEFDSAYMREIIEKRNVILPIWHGVSQPEVFQYSPRLAGKVGLDSSLGAKELAKRLAVAIKRAEI